MNIETTGDSVLQTAGETRKTEQAQTVAVQTEGAQSVYEGDFYASTFDPSTNEQIIAVDAYARQNETPPRYEHSLRVARFASALCKRFGIDEAKGYLAGIGHDMCKEAIDVVTISYAVRDGKSVSAVERTKPALLHGRAAAMMLKIDFNITDNDIIEAVQNHVFAACGLCDLAKIIFIADKTEPGRGQVTAEYVRRIEALSLEELFRFVVNENVEYLTKRGKTIAPATLELVKSFER